MHWRQSWLILAAALSASVAQAQTVTIATTQPGSITHSIGSAVAKVATDAGIRTIVQPQGSSALGPVNAKISEFGFSNSYDVVFFVTGTGEYIGRGPQKNVRVVSRMLVNISPVLVRANSDIKTGKDLRGKRIPGGFVSQKSLLASFMAHLANAGLTYNDVVEVLAPNVVKSADDFAAGKVDAFTFGLGAAKLKEVAATVGPLRALPMDTDPAAVKRAEAVLPTSYMTMVQPAPIWPEIKEPIPVLAFDMAMETHADVPDEVVYRIVKAMHDHAGEMRKIFAGLRAFDPNEMAVKYDVLEYHPGAIKFYKEIGQWPPKQR
jgi:TRAP transporter TAXI family solute receptor